MTEVAPRARDLAGGEHRRAAAVLARAFQADPMMVHLLPDTGRRARVLPSFLGSCLRDCERHGVVTTTADVDAVAAWLPPGRTSVSTARMVRAGMLTAMARLGLGGVRRAGALVGAMERAHHAAAPEPHWYLWLLGTDPARTGRGLAGAVLAPLLARADAEARPCYLDTHLEANLAFYARHGFEPVAGEVVDGLRFWGLRRQPR